MDNGAWRATVHGVTKSQTQLSDLTLSLHTWKVNPLICNCSSPILLFFRESHSLDWVKQMGLAVFLRLA